MKLFASSFKWLVDCFTRIEVGMLMKRLCSKKLKISSLLAAFVLSGSLSANAAAVTVPYEVKLLVDEVKNDYRDIGGRAWRYQTKKHWNEQVKMTRAELLAAEKEYDLQKQNREKLVASYEASGIAKEQYDTFADVQQLYALERSCQQQVEFARTNHENALSEQKKFLDMLSNQPIYASFYTGVKVFNWEDKEGDSGSEVLMPFGTWMGNKKYHIGVYGTYVFAKNDTQNYDGSIYTLTDTYVDLCRRWEISDRKEVAVFLALNIPTGRSALNNAKRNARMTDDLVEVEEFGSNWEITPGIHYIWRPFKYDKWTFGTHVSFRPWRIDTTSDAINDNTKEGREWSKFIRYQHAEEKWQFVAEIHNTSYQRTYNESGWGYKSDDQWKYKLTFNRQIAKDQEMLFYYWPEYQTNDGNNAQPLAESSWVHYFGTRWSKFMDDQNTLRLSLDVLNTSGLRYNGLRSWYEPWGPQSHYNQVSGRKKYSIGVGYDHKFKNSDTIAVDLRYFWMKDGPSSFGEPATRYKGFSIFVMYSKNTTFHW